MGGGGGKVPAHTTSVTTIRYAPYIESYHNSFLSTMATERNAILDSSPYSSYVDVEIDPAFFGLGFAMTSFPSLYDIYGKFMAGLDIEALWDQVFNSTINSTSVSDLVVAESALIDDDIATHSIPRLQTGMRDINSVMTSSYPLGMAVIEDARVKSIAKFSAELKYKLVPVAESRWQSHLQWNQQVVTIYAEIMKFYFAAKHDTNEDNYAFAAKDKLWPFTVMEFERAAIGSLQGASNSRVESAGASTGSRVISGALGGAAMGATVGGAIKDSAGGNYAGTGAIAGAVLGAAAAYFY